MYKSNTTNCIDAVNISRYVEGSIIDIHALECLSYNGCAMPFINDSPNDVGGITYFLLLLTIVLLLQSNQIKWHQTYQNCTSGKRPVIKIVE